MLAQISLDAPDQCAPEVLGPLLPAPRHLGRTAHDQVIDAAHEDIHAGLSATLETALHAGVEAEGGFRAQGRVADEVGPGGRVAAPARDDPVDGVRERGQLADAGQVGARLPALGERLAPVQRGLPLLGGILLTDAVDLGASAERLGAQAGGERTPPRQRPLDG